MLQAQIKKSIKRKKAEVGLNVYLILLLFMIPYLPVLEKAGENHVLLRPSIIRYPVIPKDIKTCSAVHFACGGVSFFYKEGNTPPQGQKVLDENRGHFYPDTAAPAVGADIDSAYLIPGKGLGAGVDLPHYLAVQLRYEDTLPGKYVLKVQPADRRIKIRACGKDFFLFVRGLEGEKILFVFRRRRTKYKTRRPRRKGLGFWPAVQAHEFIFDALRREVALRLHEDFKKFRVFPQSLKGMDGNFSQKTIQEAGTRDAGVLEAGRSLGSSRSRAKYRKEGTAAVEKQGGNFTLVCGQEPHVAAAFPDIEKAGAGGDAEFFPLLEISLRFAVFVSGYLPPADVFVHKLHGLIRACCQCRLYF